MISNLFLELMIISWQITNDKSWVSDRYFGLITLNAIAICFLSMKYVSREQFVTKHSSKLRNELKSGERRRKISTFTNFYHRASCRNPQKKTAHKKRELWYVLVSDEVNSNVLNYWLTVIAQQQSVGSGEKAEWKFSSTGDRAPGYRALTELFPKIRAVPSSWLGTKNALYYCAQSASSFSWVLFVSSYTTAIVSITACLAHAPKKCTQSGNFQFDIKSPSDFKRLSAQKLKTLFQKYKLELTRGIHTCIGHVLRKQY